MTKFTDVGIKALIAGDIRFEGRADAVTAGLILSYRDNDKVPRWLFRYSFAGKRRKMVIGNYGNMSLAEARTRARELSARVQLGYDVQGEKIARIVEAVAAIEAERASITVNELAEDYLNREIIGRVKHPNIPINQYEKNIRPLIGTLKIEAVTSLHVDDILEAVRKRGAPSIANKALRMLQNMFDYAIRRRMIAVNPAAAFRTKDAGGEMEARDRALSRTELALLFAAMKQAKGFSVQNELTIKLLLVLCCRKMELCAAQWDEFDLDAAIWHMRDDVKTGKGLDVPLPPCAVEWLRELKRLSGASPYILPARKMQHRGLPHICEGTIGTAMGKLKPHMPDVEAFTVHDLRRTARTQLAALGVNVITAERCLNHKIKGIHGTYDRHDYFDERKDALIKWADLMRELELGGSDKVVNLKNRKRKTA